MHETHRPESEVVGAYLQRHEDEASKAEVEPGDEDEETPEQQLAKEPLHVQAAYEFLGRKHCTLWADFIIADHHGRLRAARWLAAQMAGVEEVIKTRFP